MLQVSTIDNIIPILHCKKDYLFVHFILCYIISYNCMYIYILRMLNITNYIIMLMDYQYFQQYISYFTYLFLFGHIKKIIITFKHNL